MANRITPRLSTRRWGARHRLVAIGSALVLVATAGTAAAEAPSGSLFGSSKVGSRDADGILLPTQQRIDPAGTRILDTAGRILSSTISPNGKYLAALTWNTFNGFLTIFDLQTGKILQQVEAYHTTKSGELTEDGNVAADGPLYSADGTSLWFPQGADLIHFPVNADGTVDDLHRVVIKTTETISNLTTGNTTTDDLPSGMELSPDGTKLYVALNGVNQLGVIDARTNKFLEIIDVGNAPRQVVLVGHTAFVSNEGGRPAKQGEYTNNSDGTNIVANKVTGAASTGTVSVVDLSTGKETAEIPVGLEPTAEYLAADGTLMVANSNDDTFSLIATSTHKVVQTVNVDPLPGSTVGSYANAITMPDSTHILVSVGRDNALAEYSYSGPLNPVKYMGLIPTDFYPVAVSYDPAIGKVVVTNDKGIGARGPESSISKGPGTSPGGTTVTGRNTYDDTGSLTEFSMPSASKLSTYTDRVFTDNDWTHLLASQQMGNPNATPVAIPTVLGDPSTIKHVFLIVRENRTYDQDFGDLGRGNGDPSLAQFGEAVTPNGHALERTFGDYDNFYDEGTLSADGHNWLVQADANDYIEKEFGAFYRSYPAQGGDALAYQRDGFIWNAAEKAGDTAESYGEYNNYDNITANDPTWTQFYKDSEIMEGKLKGELPIPESAVHTYSDIPSLNAIDDTEFPPFDLNIPDQYRADVFLQSFDKQVAKGTVPNLNMLWVMDDHTSGSTGSVPQPTAEVADNDLATGRIISAITKSPIWKSSVIFVLEDDSQNGADHVDGHRAPLIIASPYAKRSIVDDTYYTQLNVVKTIEQILDIAPMNQEDRAAVPMTNDFTNTPDLATYTPRPETIPLTAGVTSSGSGSSASGSSASAASQHVPASETAIYQEWLSWARGQHFGGANAIADWANPAQLNRFDWYSAHNWATPYPGDTAILAPGQVPGADMPADYLGD